MDADFRFHRLPDEGDHIRGRNPGRAQTRRDVGGAKVNRLYGHKRANILLEGRIDNCGGFGDPELVAHCS